MRTTPSYRMPDPDLAGVNPERAARPSRCCARSRTQPDPICPARHNAMPANAKHNAWECESNEAAAYYCGLSPARLSPAMCGAPCSRRNLSAILAMRPAAAAEPGGVACRNAGAECGCRRGAMACPTRERNVVERGMPMQPCGDPELKAWLVNRRSR